MQRHTRILGVKEAIKSAPAGPHPRRHRRQEAIERRANSRFLLLSHFSTPLPFCVLERVPSPSRAHSPSPSLRQYGIPTGQPNSTFYTSRPMTCRFSDESPLIQSLTGWLPLGIL
jgi:hypothetical protein